MQRNRKPTIRIARTSFNKMPRCCQTDEDGERLYWETGIFWNMVLWQRERIGWWQETGERVIVKRWIDWGYLITCESITRALQTHTPPGDDDMRFGIHSFPSSPSSSLWGEESEHLVIEPGASRDSASPNTITAHLYRRAPSISGKNPSSLGVPLHPLSETGKCGDAEMLYSLTPPLSSQPPSIPTLLPALLVTLSSFLNCLPLLFPPYNPAAALIWPLAYRCIRIPVFEHPSKPLCALLSDIIVGKHVALQITINWIYLLFAQVLPVSSFVSIENSIYCHILFLFTNTIIF